MALTPRQRLRRIAVRTLITLVVIGVPMGIYYHRAYSHLRRAVTLLNAGKDMEARGQLEAHLAADAASETCPFRSLSTAWAQDGAVIRMPKGQKLDGPIHVLNLGTPGKSPASTSLRHLVIAEPNSEISVVERYAGIDESATYFTNSAIDVHIGRNASVHHYKVQRESEASLHLGSMRVQQDAAARFRSVCISAGGALARHDIETRQLGEGTETDLSGLALVDGRRHADFRVLVHHSRSHGTSKQFYKSILDNESTAVFNGRIVADHGTVGTDAQQTNNNLLLTDGAVANTRPQLEIYADDIACSHGATVGQLDADAMFYLQSRGLPKRRAESLLTYAFASDIVDRVTIEPIRHRIHEYLATRMECGDELGEDS